MLTLNITLTKYVVIIFLINPFYFSIAFLKIFPSNLTFLDY